MTEYDFSPEAYERFIQTQNRVANWVQHTEQHRQVFEAAVPGAPGVPPVARRPSPPLPDRYTSPHRPSPAYPIYRRSPPSSSSDDSYVHVPSPQVHRPRLPHLPIYAPQPPPAFTPFPIQPYPSPAAARGTDDHHRTSSSSRRRHHRSQSHTHPHRPPPLVSPIYTSPPASPYYSPEYVVMSPRGYIAPPKARPIISQAEQLQMQQNPLLSPQTKKTHHPLERPPTPPATPSTLYTPSSTYYTSAPNSPTSLPFPPSPAIDLGPSSSGLGGSRSQLPLPPPQEDRNKKQGRYHQHRAHSSVLTVSGFGPPSDSRSLQQFNNLQPHDFDPYLNKPSVQSRNFPTALRPQPRRDPYERGGATNGRRETSRPKTATTGVISVSVPAARYPPDDRKPAYEPPHLSSRATQVPVVIHAPQPTRHPNVLSPRLRASARA